MAGMSVIVEMPRRPAIVEYANNRHEVFVLAILQEGESPVCVCEHLDGKIRNYYTEHVTFVDTEGGMLK